MKRVLFFALMLFILNNILAQKIVVDKTENGIRHISCSDVNLKGFRDKIGLSVCLNATSKENTTLYALSTSLVSNYPISSPEEARILIKLKNDDVIELKAEKPCEDRVGNTMIIANTPYKIYKIHPLFNISKDQIENLSNGVKKVRIELNGTENYEKEFSKDKIGKQMVKEYNLINNALLNNKRKTFSTDF